MPTSIFDPEILEITREARSKKSKKIVKVDGKDVEIQKPFPSPADWRDQFIYMIMIDRFNNPDAPPKHTVFTSKGKVRAVDLQGGTIKGIHHQLGYLQSLGVTAIWMTPVFKNTQFQEGSYHGYGIHDFLSIDPRFGTEQQLHELIDEAHARGMYIIFDIVINHAGDVFEYPGHGSTAPFRNFPYEINWRKGDGTPNPNWKEAPQVGDPELTPDAAIFPDETRDNSFFRRKGKSSNESGELQGDFESLKEFVTDSNEIRDILIKTHQYAIAKFDVDGFRIDTLKHVERDFARIFGNAMREFALSIGKKNFFTYGETKDDDKKIAEYTGRFARDEDNLIGVDSALDFPLLWRLPGVVKGFIAPVELADMYEYRKNLHRGKAQESEGVLISTHGEISRFFVTFLDNHDEHNRFRHSFDTSDLDRFDNEVSAFDAQVSMGIGCLFSLQGIPCLYYGTEQGLDGTGDNGDKNVREALWGSKSSPFNTDNPFYKAIQEIAAVRARHPALRYGRQFFRAISGNQRDFGISDTSPGIIAFSRILNDMEVIVVANAVSDLSFNNLLVIVDFNINPDGIKLDLLYSNKGTNATSPGNVITKPHGSVIVRQRFKGNITNGHIRALPVTLKPLEIQIIGNNINIQP